MAGWICTASAPNRARSTGTGIELLAELPAEARYFVFNGRGQPGFDEPPPAEGVWSTAPGATYRGAYTPGTEKREDAIATVGDGV